MSYKQVIEKRPVSGGFQYSIGLGWNSFMKICGQLLISNVPFIAGIALGIQQNRIGLLEMHVQTEVK